MKRFINSLIILSFIFLSQTAAVGDTIVAAEVLGSNSPFGTSYDEPIDPFGGTQTIAGGSLEVTPTIFNLSQTDFIFQATYRSTNGGFVSNTGSNWFANYRLFYDRPTEASRYYFWFESSGGPLPLTPSDGIEIVEHPFDPNIVQVATIEITRPLELEHQLGIFSNPFSSLTGRLGVNPNEVEGFGLATVLSSPVPEPLSSPVLAILLFTVLRRRTKQ